MVAFESISVSPTHRYQLYPTYASPRPEVPCKAALPTYNMAPGTIEPDFRQEPLRNKEVAVETKNDEAPLTMEEIFAYERDYSVAGMPPHPVIITKAQGAHLWDSEGKQYVDLLAGFCSANQGHCHPKIIATLREQCLKMTLPGRAVYTEAYSRMCRRMCHVGGITKLQYSNSSSLD